MPLIADVHTLEPGTYIEMFILDASTAIPSGTISRFHSGTNQLSQPLRWQGNLYSPFPIEASGFEITGAGTLPRPTLRLSNIEGLLGALSDANNDMVGARLTRKRTLLKYIDAENFASGVNPTADPNYEWMDSWEIQRKISQDKTSIEFELSSPLDAEGTMLPGRIIAQTCTWKIYRGTECAYVGAAMFTLNDVPTNDPALDRCSRRLGSCQIRNHSPNFGGFPSVGTISR